MHTQPPFAELFSTLPRALPPLAAAQRGGMVGVKLLLFALAVLAQGSAWAVNQTVTFTSSGEWGPAGTFTGSFTGSNSGNGAMDADPEDDDYVCTGGLTITLVANVTTGDLDLGDCTLNAESRNRTGGEGPMAIRLTTDGGSLTAEALVIDAGTLRVRGRVLSWGVGVTHPTYTDAPEAAPGRYATLGDVIPCGGDPACASDRGVTRIAYPPDEYDRNDGQAGDANWDLYLAEIVPGADSTAAPSTLQLFSPSGDAEDPSASAGHTFTVVGRDATCTGPADCYIDLDTTQDDGGDELAYPSERRQWITGTIQAPITPGDPCVTIQAGTLEDDGHYDGHALYLERDGAFDASTPYLIAKGVVTLPRFGGHPRSHGSAVGVCHGKTEAAVLFGPVQG